MWRSELDSAGPGSLGPGNPESSPMDCLLPGTPGPQKTAGELLIQELAKGFFKPWEHLRCVTAWAVAENNTNLGVGKQREKRGDL